MTSYIWIIGSSIITHAEEAAYAKNQGKLRLEGRPLVWKQGNALEQPAPKSSVGDAHSSSAGNVGHPCQGK